MVLSYTDRAALLSQGSWQEAVTINGIIKPLILVKGQAIGTWTRTTEGKKMIVAVEPFTSVPRGARDLMEEAAGRYAAFLGKEVEIRLTRRTSPPQ
jgi:hypothetical protein